MIRVLRLLEYSYEDVERMSSDMSRWAVGANSTVIRGSTTIRSATLLPEYIANIPEDDA